MPEPEPAHRGRRWVLSVLRVAAATAILGALLAYSIVHVAHRRLPRPNTLTSENRALGAYHVHSDASHDGTWSLEQLAAMAAAQNLDFLVVTDHNNQLPQPIQIDGVTILSFAELSTPFGHVVQLGAPRLLRRELREQLAVHRHIRAAGGWPILAHPSDPKNPWTGPLAGAAGLEINNVAASLRRRGGPGFLRLLADVPIFQLNPKLALAQLYMADPGARAVWARAPNPNTVGFCANNLHGRIPAARHLLTFWTLVVEGEWPPANASKPQALLHALATGNFYCSAGLFGGPLPLRFGARRDGDWLALPERNVARNQVDELAAVGPVLAGAPDSRMRLVLLRRGEPVAKTRGATLRYPNPLPGNYRVEVHMVIPDPIWGRHVAPVAYSNRIRVNAGAAPAPPATPPL